MRRIFKLFVVGVLFFQIQFVEAECSNQEITDLKKAAEAITMNSEFDRESVTFGVYDNYVVTVQGLMDNMYILSKDQSVGFYPENAVDGVITNHISSVTDEFRVYSSACPDVNLRTIKLSMKLYNMYSDYEECEGISGDELDVCGEFYDGNISYEQFIKKVEEYKNGSSSLSSGGIGNFFKDYAIYIGLGLGALLVVIIVLILIRRKRNRLD